MVQLNSNRTKVMFKAQDKQILKSLLAKNNNMVVILKIKRLQKSKLADYQN